MKQHNPNTGSSTFDFRFEHVGLATLMQMHRPVFLEIGQENTLLVRSNG